MCGKEEYRTEVIDKTLDPVWTKNRFQFGAKQDLEDLLGRGGDQIEPGAVRNPFLLASINRNREAIYAA